MKYNHLLASLITAMMMTLMVNGQSTRPGTVTFKDIHGTVVSHNSNTGLTEEVTTESLLTEGFSIATDSDGYLDILFSNGVVGRLAPNSKVLIESFAVTGGNSSNERSVLNATNNRTLSAEPNLTLFIECGDIIINSTVKEEGTLMVKTPTTQIDADLCKFFASHGKLAGGNQAVSRAINLDTTPIVVTSRVENAFQNGSGNEVSYGQYQAYSEEGSVSLELEKSAVVFSESLVTENGSINTSATDSMIEDTATAASSSTSTGYTLNTEINDPYANNPTVFQENCDKGSYAVLPYDRCLIERLGFISDHVLLGGQDPLGTLLIVAAAADSTYEAYEMVGADVNLLGEQQLLVGMTLPEKTIIRTSDSGSVKGIFPNGASIEVQPNTSATIESVSTQPVLSDPSIANRTNIGVRVELGRILANTIGTPIDDQFSVISPLDNHMVSSDTVGTVEFLQVDNTAFNAVSQNQTPEGTSGINSVVLSSSNLSFISDLISFIEYQADGSSFSFSTPPSYTHVTESAIIPPDYSFIDRTIGFAADVIGPQSVITPTPGDTPRYEEETTPLTP